MAECPVNDKLIKLLSEEYQNLQQYEIDDYIRKLRKTIISLRLKNEFLEKKETYLPNVLKEFDSTQKYLYFTQDEIEKEELLEKNVQYAALTITYDINFFPQLIITPLWEQENYIKRVLMKFIQENHFQSIYGSYELQQNGRIHFHGIIPYYAATAELQDQIATYFTSRQGKSQKAVLVKPVNDIQGWLNYINKKDSYKKIINYKKTSNYF